MPRFESKHILIAGATSEIGAAIARQLVSEGARVTLTGRDEVRLNELTCDLSGRAISIPCDLTNDESHLSVFKQASSAFGALNGLIYAAGFHRLTPANLDADQVFQQHLNLNSRIPLRLARLFSQRKYSDDSQQRSITIIASILHRIGEPALYAYAASKGAIVSATRSLAVELARKNIRINTISPGWIEGASALRTKSMLPDENNDHIMKIYPLGQGSPEDVAEAAAYLSSSSARWITGTDLVVDGGRSCV